MSSISSAKQNLESKHPVSLLGEICAKRKYGAPMYEVVSEAGPFHSRQFLFKVIFSIFNVFIWLGDITMNDVSLGDCQRYGVSTAKPEFEQKGSQGCCCPRRITKYGSDQ